MKLLLFEKVERVAMLVVLIALFLIATSLSQEPGSIRDLGVLSPTTLIPLDRNTSRGDFAAFEVEAMNGKDTNAVTKFVTTNAFLSVTNFTALPSGRTLLGLRSIGTDGSGSAVILFSFDLRRGESFPAPSAGTVVRATTGTENSRLDGVSREGQEDNLRRALGRYRASSASPSPPLPPGMKKAEERVELKLAPLPRGRNETYAEGMDRIADATRRRNE